MNFEVMMRKLDDLGVPRNNGEGIVLEGTDRIQILADSLLRAEWELFDATHPDLYTEEMGEESKVKVLREAVLKFLEGRDRSALQKELAEKRQLLVFEIVKMNQSFSSLFAYCASCGKPLDKPAAHALGLNGLFGLFHSECADQWAESRKAVTRAIIGDGKITENYKKFGDGTTRLKLLEKE